MSEILVRVIDQVSDDPYKDVRLTKAGHVIAIAPDGWGWSTIELTTPIWRIFRLPGISEADLFHLTIDEGRALYKANPLDPKANLETNPMLQIRAYKIDFTLLPAAVAKRVLGTRVGIIDVPKALLDAAVARIAARANPNVIG